MESFLPTQESDSTGVVDGARRRPRGLARREAGFTLTEIALAMSIFAFALVSMLGLLTVGVRNSRKANIQISASNLLSAITADIQSSKRTNLPDNGFRFECSKTPLQTTVIYSGVTDFTVKPTHPDPLILDEGGSVSTDPMSSGVLKVFRVKCSPALSSIPALRIRVSWPANLSDAAGPEGFLETIAPLPLP